jgi:hypothetical protein
VIKTNKAPLKMMMTWMYSVESSKGFFDLQKLESLLECIHEVSRVHIEEVSNLALEVTMSHYLGMELARVSEGFTTDCNDDKIIELLKNSSQR